MTTQKGVGFCQSWFEQVVRFDAEEILSAHTNPLFQCLSVAGRLSIFLRE